MTDLRAGAQQALEALTIYSDAQCSPKGRNAITALREALAQPEQEPVEVDQATMEVAESVGLIGPASRTHDLHAAIQRFHDLICANATIKAAAAFSRTLEAKDEPVAWKWHQAPVKTSWGHDMVVADLAIDKDNTMSIYCERDQTAKVKAMFTPPAAQRPWQGLTDEDKQTAVWTDGTFGGGALWAQQLLKERNNG